jgi:hypothetical protein
LSDALYEILLAVQSRLEPVSGIIETQLIVCHGALGKMLSASIVLSVILSGPCTTRGISYGMNGIFLH